MATMPMDPFKVLEISNPKNFTAAELKRNYKKLVMRYHPDKNVTEIKTTPIFQTITFCYTYLVNELKTREDGKDHNTLKTQNKEFEERDRGQGAQNIKIDPKSFNAKKFNAFFEENKFREDGADGGYGAWFKSEKAEDNGAIIHYSDPEPLMMGGSKLGNLYEFGKGSVDDYSGNNMSSKGLNYMDLKKAYTTSSIVDERYVEKRQEFKSVEEANIQRAKVSFVMNDDELAMYNKRKEQDDKREEARLQNMKKENSVIEQIYLKTNKIMLGMFGSTNVKK